MDRLSGRVLTYDEDDGKCRVRIFTSGSSDRTSWYKIWEAVSALFYGCAVRQMGASFYGLGIEKGRCLIESGR